MLKELCAARALPPLSSREEMLSILLEREYGQMPPSPSALRFDSVKNTVPHFCGGRATVERVTAVCTVGEREFCFPFTAVLPTDGKAHPFFVLINFRPDVPDRYYPTEELVDAGYAVLSFCYLDVTSDDGDMQNGLSGLLFPSGIRPPNGAGKLAMWAWAAHRLMDYAETRRDVLDTTRATVCGHSRLGKTALLAAATDKRFYCGYSNDSGCSGAAVTRDKRGERVADIVLRFPFWFCENYSQYRDAEHQMPFDQHFLIAAIAPRLVCVGSATEDIWADPESEQLACLAASSAYEAQGVCGFLSPDRFAEAGEGFLDGRIGYHLREGEHYLSRRDWLQLLRFLQKHEESHA